jgi:hypothetical protein
VAAYSYKEVMYREDFQAAIEPAMKSMGFEAKDYEGEADYDGDGWLVAAFLLEQKDAEIAELEAAIQAAKNVVREHDRVGSTSASRRATIITLREALYRLEREK